MLNYTSFYKKIYFFNKKKILFYTFMILHDYGSSIIDEFFILYFVRSLYIKNAGIYVKNLFKKCFTHIVAADVC